MTANISGYETGDVSKLWQTLKTSVRPMTRSGEGEGGGGGGS